MGVGENRIELNMNEPMKADQEDFHCIASLIKVFKHYNDCNINRRRTMIKQNNTLVKMQYLHGSMSLNYDKDLLYETGNVEL